MSLNDNSVIFNLIRHEQKYLQAIKISSSKFNASKNLLEQISQTGETVHHILTQIHSLLLVSLCHQLMLCKCLRSLGS